MEPSTAFRIVLIADLMDAISNLLGFLLFSVVFGLASSISYFRMGLAGIAAWSLILGGSPGWAMTLVALAVALDAVDGYVARALKTVSQVGRYHDRMFDYFVAGMMWITLSFLGVVSFLVPVITIGRDVLVALKGPIPLGKFGWLSSARSMRTSYALLKLASWELAIWSVFNEVGMALDVLVWSTVAVCILRALPILAKSEKNDSL